MQPTVLLIINVIRRPSQIFKSPWLLKALNQNLLSSKAVFSSTVSRRWMLASLIANADRQLHHAKGNVEIIPNVSTIAWKTNRKWLFFRSAWVISKPAIPLRLNLKIKFPQKHSNCVWKTIACRSWWAVNKKISAKNPFTFAKMNVEKIYDVFRLASQSKAAKWPLKSWVVPASLIVSLPLWLQTPWLLSISRKTLPLPNACNNPVLLKLRSVDKINLVLKVFKNAKIIVRAFSIEGAWMKCQEN